MYGFFVRRDEKKVAVVGRWPLAEVRLDLCDIFVFLVSQIWKTAKQTSG